MMLFPGEGSGEVGLRDVFYEAAIGATGAIGVVTRTKDVTVSRTGTGVYLFTIDPALGGVGALVDYSAQVIDSAVAAGNGLWGIVTAKSANSVTITFYNNSAVAADPRNGASIIVHLAIKSSTV